MNTLVSGKYSANYFDAGQGLTPLEERVGENRYYSFLLIVRTSLYKYIYIYSGFMDL